MEIQLLEEWTACEPIALYVQNKNHLQKVCFIQSWICGQ